MASLRRMNSVFSPHGSEDAALSMASTNSNILPPPSRIIEYPESRLGIWSLVDISIFTKAQQNHNLTFSTAMQNNLMSLLAGDFLIFFNPGFGLHLHFRKLAPRDENGVLQCVVDQAYFLGSAGERFKKLGGGLWPFFMTLDLDSELVETETHLHQSYVVREGHNSQFAHRGFPALFSTGKQKHCKITTSGSPRICELALKYIF
jgi:hypothetical protein